jgi:hypothetical protein
MKSFFDWRFILVACLVIVAQVFLFSVVIQNGFTSDDWWLLFDYKTIGFGLGFIEKYIQTLRVVGLYHTYQVTM